VLLVCDHAGRAIPRLLSQLGLADWVLDRHVAWDIGAAQVAAALADRLDAPLVLAGYSRLVIDPNRHLDDPTACPATSDGIAIPGNQGLGSVDRARRAVSCRDPYHAEIAARLGAFAARGVTPAVVAVHTCTPVFNDVVRQWHVGVMWDEDPRIAVPLISALGRDGICVGDNEPYSGRDPDDYTLDTHAEAGGLPYVGIEVRQDLVDTDAGAARWAGVLADALTPILDDDALYRPFVKPA
jgi:predicted N-formylglutamate amidohydrolase